MVKLTSYGFIRREEEDFRDDGNKFKVYMLPGCPNIRITMCHDKEYGYFISANVNSFKLTYKEYSTIPGYRSLDILNGGLNEEQVLDEINQFVNNIREFQANYNEAVKNLQTISDEEIINGYKKIYDFYQARLNEVEELLTKENLLNLLLTSSSYKIDYFKNYYNQAKKELNRYIPEEAVKLSQHNRREFLQRSTNYSDFYTRELKKLLRGE